MRSPEGYRRMKCIKIKTKILNSIMWTLFMLADRKNIKMVRIPWEINPKIDNIIKAENPRRVTIMQK